MKTIKAISYILSSASLLLLFSLSSCGQPTEPILTTEPVLAEEAEPTEASPAEPAVSEQIVTQITIDGDPSDWEGYDVLIIDPEGDHQGGGFDIAEVRAFTNDQFLYILIETHEPATDYVQIDLDIFVGEKHYVVSINPRDESTGWMGDVTGSEWIDIGEIVDWHSKAGEAIEYKMPLSSIDYATEIKLGVRPYAGECCEYPAWHSIDEIDPVLVPHVGELEVAPSPAIDESELGITQNSVKVCNPEIAPQKPFGVFDPAPIQLLMPEYSAEWFVAPGTFNNPQQVLVSPKGELLVNSPHGELTRLADDGTTQIIADKIGGYYGDIDSQGNVYIHSFDGYIARVTPEGKVSRITESLPSAPGHVGFALGPDGNLYAAQTHFDDDKDDLYQITLSGQITLVAKDIPTLAALRTVPDGRLLGIGTVTGLIYEVSIDDFSLTDLGAEPIPWATGNGLVGDDAGNVYISTGSDRAGDLYKITPDGEVTVLATFPDNGLSGIAWLSSTGEIVGAQASLGGIIAVDADGNKRSIVSGNGIVTPMGIAFTPCGELAITNDEGGFMALADPSGNVVSLFNYNSYGPPLSFVAIDPDGMIFTTEANPNPIPMRVTNLPLGKENPDTYLSIDWTVGVAYDVDRGLFVSQGSSGDIILAGSPGVSEKFASGLNFPQSITLDDNNNLYVITGPSGFSPTEQVPVPFLGDKIVRISPEGEVTTVANLPNVIFLAVGPEGDLFASVANMKGEAGKGKVVKIGQDGTQTTFASNFKDPLGMAFDLVGNLYIADYGANGIVRVSGFPQGTISGIVTNTRGLPIEDAPVQVLSVNPIVVGQVVYTDAEGHFSLPAAPRIYSIIVAFENYDVVTLDDVKVIPGQESNIEIELE